MKKLFSSLKNPKVRRVVLILSVLIVIIVGYLYYTLTANRVSIDNSLIQAPVINISPSLPSKLKEIDVYEGQVVKKGDQLAVTDNETLRADTDGLVVSVNNQIGSSVSVQSPAVQIIQQPDIRVVGTIDENKGLNNIRVGQVVSFTVDAFPGKTFWGFVDEISPSAKQTTLAFSISTERPTQQFQIFARFDINQIPQIKNGMSAKMIIYTETK